MRLPTLTDVGDSTRLNWADPILVCDRPWLNNFTTAIPDIAGTSYCQRQIIHALCSIFKTVNVVFLRE